MSWEEVEIHPLLRQLVRQNLGFARPTEVQREFLQFAGQQVDVIAASKTGSGKTMCYLLAILSALFHARDEEPDEAGLPDALILVPTRELACQVLKDCQGLLGPGHWAKLAVVIGGLSREKQLRLLGRGPRVVVATPGRLWDLVESGQLPALRRLAGVRFLVLDEVDRIIELNQFKELGQLFNYLFREVVAEQRILRRNPELAAGAAAAFVEAEGQTIPVLDELEAGAALMPDAELAAIERRLRARRTFVLSATLTHFSSTSRMSTNKKFKAFLARNKKAEARTGAAAGLAPKVLEVLRKVRVNHAVRVVDLTQNAGQLLPAGLAISKLRCSSKEKFYCLYHLLSDPAAGPAIVFVNSISAARKIRAVLDQLQVGCTNLHSHMKQPQRLKKINAFAGGKRRVLIATDVGSRGLDIPAVELVVHFHLPRDFDTFVHRCGRTARQDRAGRAVILSDAFDQQRWIRYVAQLRDAAVEPLRVDKAAVYKHQKLIDRVLQLESDAFGANRRQKEKNFADKHRADIGLPDSAEEQTSGEDERALRSTKTGNAHIKRERQAIADELHNQQFNVEKRYSSFLSPADIALINSQFKRVKAA